MPRSFVAFSFITHRFLICLEFLEIFVKTIQQNCVYCMYCILVFISVVILDKYITMIWRFQIKNSESYLLGFIDMLPMLCMILPSLPFPWCTVTLSWYKWSCNKNNPMFYNKTYVSYIMMTGWSKDLGVCRHGIGIIFKTSSDMLGLSNLAELGTHVTVALDIILP